MKRKHLGRRILNRLLARLADHAPGATSLRPLLHRWRGVVIHGRVFIGDQVYLENEYPECIEIHAGAQLSVRCTLIAHVRGPGKIVIGRDVLVGPGCVITATPGTTLTVGEGAVVSGLTPVTRSVPPGTLYASGRPGVIARVTTPLAFDTSFDDFRKGLRSSKRETAP